jgi:hypothetical protein
MSQHINRFIDRLRQAENRQQRDIVLSISDARDLHADITRLLIMLEQTRQEPQAKSQETQEIQVSGGIF